MAERFDNVYAIKKRLKKAKYSNNFIKERIKKIISNFEGNLQRVRKYRIPINKFKNDKVLLKGIKNVEQLKNIQLIYEDC